MKRLQPVSLGLVIQGNAATNNPHLVTLSYRCLIVANQGFRGWYDFSFFLS